MVVHYIQTNLLYILLWYVTLVVCILFVYSCTFPTGGHVSQKI